MRYSRLDFKMRLVESFRKKKGYSVETVIGIGFYYYAFVYEKKGTFPLPNNRKRLFVFSQSVAVN